MRARDPLGEAGFPSEGSACNNPVAEKAVSSPQVVPRGRSNGNVLLNRNAMTGGHRGKTINLDSQDCAW